MMDVQKAWTRLLSVQELSFEAQSRTAPNTGWNGSGKGTVRVEKIDAGVILFHVGVVPCFRQILRAIFSIIWHYKIVNPSNGETESSWPRPCNRWFGTFAAWRGCRG